MTKDDSKRFENSLLKNLDTKLGGHLSEASSEEDFTGKPGQSMVLRVSDHGAKRIGFIGLGKSAANAYAFGNFGEAIAAASKNAEASNVGIEAMTAATKKHYPSSSKPPKNHHSTPNTTTTTTPQPNITQDPNPTTNPSPLSPTLKDQVLSRATHITRHELLKRRSYKLKQLSKCFRDHYWALMEELKIQYREYYWKYGVSPFKEDNQKQEQQKQGGGVGVLQRENEESGANIEVIGENNTNVSDLKSNHRCLFVGCKLKAMALTSFCHLHILSDAKQKLYKPCGYVIK
ncbi:hypothetical protein OIU74_006512, partial [Salix koriyanagi]